MMKRIFLVTVALLFALIAAPAGAKPFGHGGQGTGAAATPVLVNVTIPLGQQTQAFVGYARLDSQTFTSPSYTPLTVSGLDLMSPAGPACANWTVAFVSGRSSTDFLYPSPVVNSSAITPNVSGTGVGNLTGDYVFRYQCTSVGGASSNTATLTIHTITNQANICGQDSFTSGWAPTNFGSTPGAKLVLGVGCDFHAKQVLLKGVTIGSTNVNRLTITVADPSRIPYVSNFTTQQLSNIDVTGIMLTGNTDVGIQANSVDIFGSVYSGTPTSNETWENSTYYGSMLMYPSTGSNGNSSQSFFSTQCTTNCVAQNLQADFVAGGFIPSDGLTATNIDIGHFSNNCTAFNTIGMVNPITLTNISCHDPLFAVDHGGGGLHQDCMQENDGAGGENLTVNGMWCIAAGGMGGRDNQGVWFGGSELNGMGYIDDCAGGNGTKLTLTSGTFFSSSYGARLWSPGNIAISDGVRVGQNGGSSCIPLLNFPTPTKIGSAGSPVPFANLGMYNVQMDGVVNVGDTYHGTDTVAEAGTSFFRHFALVDQRPNPYPQVSFTGKIEGSITSPYSGSTYATGTNVTVSTEPTVSSLSILPILFQTALSYSGCPAPSSNAFCNTSNTSTGVSNGLSIGGEAWSLEPVKATGTATLTNGSSTMTISGPCTGRWDYDISSGVKYGGLMIDGAGVSDFYYILPQLFLPSNGCAGTYKLNANYAGTSGTFAVEGRPSMGLGVYGLYNYGTGATPTSAIAMTAWQTVGIPANSWAFYQQNCTNNYNHQGTFQIQSGYSSGGFNLCGAPVTNTTTSNLVTPVAADFATGILPSVSLSAITAAVWDALDTDGSSTQKKALVCNKMLPAVGHALDAGGGVFYGPFTATGEFQTGSGNVPVIGCGVH